MIFNPRITKAGLAAFFNAQSTGVKLELTHMGYGTASYDPVGDETALRAEAKRLAIGAGTRISEYQIRISSIWASDTDSVDVSEVGFYAGNILFAVASRATGGPYLYKRPGSNLIFSYDWTIAVVPVSGLEIKVDPDTMALLIHMSDVNAHPQYLTTTEYSQRDSKNSVRVATTTSINLSGTQTIDGVAVAAGDRVLVKNQASPANNGIYVAAVGAWVRATDADTSAKMTPNVTVAAEQGAVNGNSVWQLTTDAPITLGTTGLNFDPLTGPTGVAAGTYRCVTVDSWGRVTDGTNPNTLAGYGITDAAAGVGGVATAAKKLESSRKISLTGAASGAADFDGSQSISISLTLADNGVIPGEYPKLTINSKGLVIGGTALTAQDIPSLGWSKITSGKPTTLGGYGITDGIKKGDYGLAASIAPSSAIDTIGLPGGFYCFGEGGTSFVNYVSLINIPYGSNAYAAQIGVQQGASEPRMFIRSVRNDTGGGWTPTREVFHTGNFNPASKANVASTLGGYGITDAYTTTQTNNQIASAIANFTAGDPIAIGFWNGFMDNNGSRFWRANGNVYVSLDISRANTPGQGFGVFQLPPGYRPKNRICGVGDWAQDSPWGVGLVSWSCEVDGVLRIDYSISSTVGASGYCCQLNFCTPFAA